MIATNLCVWLNVLILETNHEIQGLKGHHGEETKSHHKRSSNYNETYNELFHQNNNNESFWKPNMFDINHLISECTRQNNIMSRLLTSSGPFLFPCTIEYRYDFFFFNSFISLHLV